MSTRRLAHLRSGFTLVEAVIAIGIVGVLVAAIMNAAGAAGKRRASAMERGAADQLVWSVMSDLLNLPVDDPDAVAEAGVTRAAHDNLLDFAAWTESPPRDRAGSTLAGVSGCTLTIVVTGRDPTNISADGASLGMYRVAVTVTRSNKVLASLETIRTRAWDKGRS